MISADEYRLRRQRLLEEVKSDAVIVAGNRAMQAGRDSAARFVQDAHFFYLTGIAESDWLAVIEKEATTLIAPTVSATHQLFDGSADWDEVKKASGADAIVSKRDGTTLLRRLADAEVSIATVGPDPHRKYYDFALNPAPAALRRQLSKLFGKYEDCRPILNKLRAIKSEAEIALIQQAIDKSIAGFKAVVEGLAGAHYEYEVEATLSYEFRRRGAAGHAYDPIVAGGGNACTLHYGRNDSRLSPDSLLLIDAGAVVEGYAADITRTYAVGAPTERQKAVHAAVVEAHRQIVSLLQPGLSIEQYLRDVDEIMKDALRSLDLLKSESDYRRYFPHAISHGLGIDVHDSLGGFATFQPGMVLTVEPGIYIPEEEIGVRIEDDILITDIGHRNLSDALPVSL